jgi:hypothetical protein
MASLFPCPNSACTYQFDADQLPAAAMVTCPICRTRFPYRAAAKPVPEEATEQESEAGWAPPRGESSPRMNRLVNPRFVPKSNKTQMYIWILAGTAVVLTLAFIVAKTARDKPFSGSNRNIEQDFETYNFKFESPGDPWVLDDATKIAMNLNCFVYRKSDSSAYAALDAMEFFGDGKKPRGPFPREVTKTAQEKLRLKFKEPAFQPPEKVQFAGKPGESFTFQGTLDDDPVVGEVYTTDFRGLGYSFAIWAKQEVWGSVRGDLAKIRGKFQIGDGRTEWKDKTPPKVFITDGGNYQLEDSDGVWQKYEPEVQEIEGKKKPPRDRKIRYISEEDLKKEDPNATMKIKGKTPAKSAKNARDHLPEADGLVMVMDKPAGDALEAAKKYVEERVKKEEGADKVTFHEEKAPDKTDDLPDNWKSLWRFTKRNSDSAGAKTFFVVNGAVIGDKLVVVEIKSDDLHAEDMEPFMIRLAASLKERR